jgi:hypothetical protein
MADTTKTDNGAEFLVELADKTGVAVTSVKDGYVLVFTKRHLEGMLTTMAAAQQDKCVVFVKQNKIKTSH